MNKKLLLSLVLAAAISSQSQAFFGFGFSSGYEGVPSAHIGFGVPATYEGPGFGFGVSIPLAERPVYRPAVVLPAPLIVRRRPIIIEKPVHLDTKRCNYWEITNNTTQIIHVINAQKIGKEIEPGETRRLSHPTSYDLTIRIGNHTEKMRAEGHFILVSGDSQELVIEQE